MSNNAPIITPPDADLSTPTWYDSISGAFSRYPSSDSMDPTVIRFLVPEGYTATLTAHLTVDDWGTLEITDTDGNSMLKISMTEQDSPAGPQGGHTQWTRSATAKLPAGEYSISVTHENVAYNPASNNSSVCNFSISATKEPKSIRILTADEYAEISQTGTNCKGYIKSNDRVANGHHAISVGLEYSDLAPDGNFNPTAVSTVPSDRFKPDNITLDSDGKAKFKVWTLANTENKSIVSLNGAVSKPISYLPAVFSDLFYVTVYYTPKESGFRGSSTTVNCLIGDSSQHTNITVKESFKAQVVQEGFGELETPYISQDGNVYPYLAKIGSNWHVYDRVLGSRNNTLTAKSSCAVDPNIIAIGSRIQVLLGDAECEAFGTNTFTAEDRGGAIQGNRIDLYWGSDEPAPNNSSLPAGLAQGLASGYAFRVILLSE